MTNKIEVDTSKLEDYVWTLQNIMTSISNIDSRLSMHASWKGYKNLQAFLWQYTSGSPLNYYNWNLSVNKEYLQSLINNVTYVESLLQQIDPLNFDSTYENAVVELNPTRKNAIDGAGLGGDFNDLVSTFNDSLGDGDELYKSLAILGDKAGDFADDIKVMGKVTEGIDIAFTAVDNFASNLDPKRAVAETVVETVVDTAVDAIALAAVTTVATAVLGAISFPVSLLVGGIALGLTATADWAVEQVTEDGDGLIETISDCIIDNTIADWFNW